MSKNHDKINKKSHSHNSNKSARRRLLFMLSLTTAFFLIEISVGYITNSMALVADSFHMLSDVVALIIAYVSVCMSPKKWSKNTFGWARAEILGALVNAVFLCALCFSIFVESIKRFYSPETIHKPILILTVGFCGLIVNLIGLFLFKDGSGHYHGHSHGPSHGHSHLNLNSGSALDIGNLQIDENYQTNDCPLERQSLELEINPSKDKTAKLINKKNPELINTNQLSSQQMNIRGVFLHVLADALGSVIVCVSALLIIHTEWSFKDFVDPFLSVIMIVLIMYSTYPLLVESAMILLQTVPTHIKVDSLQNKLLSEIDGVLAVHEFHVWQLAGDRIIASAHIRCRNLQDYMQIAEKIKSFFHDMGIHSTTIQPEFVDILNVQTKEDQQNCILDCPTNKTCVAQTCCGLQQKKKQKNDHSTFKVDLNDSDSNQTLTKKDSKSSSEQKWEENEFTVIDVCEQPRDNSISNNHEKL